MEATIKKNNCGQIVLDDVAEPEYDPIDYSDPSLYEEDPEFLASLDKEYYTPEEAYELVMKEIRAIYEMKDAV